MMYKRPTNTRLFACSFIYPPLTPPPHHHHLLPPQFPSEPGASVWLPRNPPFRNWRRAARRCLIHQNWNVGRSHRKPGASQTRVSWTGKCTQEHAHTNAATQSCTYPREHKWSVRRTKHNRMKINTGHDPNTCNVVKDKNHSTCGAVNGKDLNHFNSQYSDDFHLSKFENWTF